MGSGISANYENITPTFTLGYWKIHSATCKETHKLVSLWLLDGDRIKSDSPTKKDRNAYIESCLYSIKTIQQLKHPNILKIYEANENLNDLAFSAEPILFSMEKDLKYSNDESYYIADQLASLASYLTNEKKFVSFHYYPGSFAFTSNFRLKLCSFNYTSLIIDSQNQTVPRYPWQNIPLAPPLNYTAPEYSNNIQTTAAADTFSYGALITSIFIGKQFFNFQNEKEIQRAIATGSFDIPESIPSDIRGLLQCCFESDPSRRLTFHEITRFPLFMSLLIRKLREIDSISKKPLSERYDFYMSLKQNINIFSQRLLQSKILPILINDVRYDIRFGPAVFPIIFYISEKMNNTEFIETVFRPLGNLFQRMDPPEYGVSVLEGVRVIINHVERNQIFDIVYPMLSVAFSSPNSSVQVAAAKNMPFLASIVAENCLAYNIIPKVCQFILTASDPKVVGYLLKTYEIGLDKMDNDMFIEGVVPTLFKLWKKIRSAQLAKPYLTIIQKQNSSMAKSIGFILPLICEMLKNEEIDLFIQGELCSFVEAKLAELRSERQIPSNNQNDQHRLSSNGSNPYIPSFTKTVQQPQNTDPNSTNLGSNTPQMDMPFFNTSSSTLSSRMNSGSPGTSPRELSNLSNLSSGNDFIVQTDQPNGFNSFDVELPGQNNQNSNNSSSNNINIINHSNSSNNNSSNNILNAQNSNDNINNSINFFSDSNSGNNSNINNSLNSSSNNSNTNVFPSYPQDLSSNNESNNSFNAETVKQSVDEFSFF